MKALVVDAEWKPGKAFAPLTNGNCMCTFPVLNEAILEHNIEFLAQKGITDIIVAFSEHKGAVDLEVIKDRNKHRLAIHLHKVVRPRGTAGLIRDVFSLIGDGDFLVLNSNLYVEDVDLEALTDFHKRNKAVATIGVKRLPPANGTTLEAVGISRDGLLESVSIIHQSMDRRSPWTFSGIYLFAPGILEHIEDKKYFDIKEQLIPALRSADLPVYAREVKGLHRTITSMEDYFKLHRDLLESNSDAVRFKGKREIAENVWVGSDTVVSPCSYLRGPIVLGSNCRIDDGAQIIGPAAIGDDCTISRDAVVRESVLWRNVTLNKRASSEYCIMGHGLKVPQGQRLRNVVAVDSLRMGDVNLIPQDYKLAGVGAAKLWRILIAAAGKLFYSLTKRLMDLIVAPVLLVVLSPIFLIIALAIKLDSAGPLFYMQKRCGRHGRRFRMFKFRTMVASAEQMHAKLLDQTDTDGPMFKMDNDPRITRIGRILRQTSLDELPQLLNVIQGQMSLVGPRPLIMEEMKFSPTWRDTRLRVKPGITGLWQVHGRSDAPFHDWIKYDIEYVMNQSLWMDLRILLGTVGVVFKKVGAR